MTSFSPLLDQLINALRCLPGVGPKSAQRMAFHLLERDKERGIDLAHTLKQSLTEVGHCEICRTFTENQHCTLCSNPGRDCHSLCIIETPADILAIEQTASFKGRYFVLMGHLSPLDGIGPEDIGLKLLYQRLQNEKFHEIILATNPTVEGEATAHYITEMIKPFNIKTTRIAHGVPLGSEIEMTDPRTLLHAFIFREEVPVMEKENS